MTTGKRNPKDSLQRDQSREYRETVIRRTFFQMIPHLKKNAHTAEKKRVLKKMDVTLKDSGIQHTIVNKMVEILSSDDVELWTMMIDAASSLFLWLTLREELRNQEGPVEVMERVTKNFLILTDLIHDFSSEKIDSAEFKRIYHLHATSNIITLQPCEALLSCIIQAADNDLATAINDDVELKTMIINAMHSLASWTMLVETARDQGDVEVSERHEKNIAILKKLFSDFRDRKINGARFKEIYHLHTASNIITPHPRTAIQPCGIP